ncbi:hypothetical protein C3451_21625 [Enterobacter sp. 301B]|nr:hypothetical protein ABR38_21775 [Enterobacter kobei]PJD27964.1 hypothetical protein B9Q26_08170 [Enterobacter hormaechei]RAY51399.1 hypothetical protein DP178_22190 [Enterobacter kobei]RQN41645.1 hypothetical protein C3451_21625 [Enterobacter sp. 301B]DAY61528.1 MAG TPA: hypothetical protein [Caudoviricetes sp.]
MSVVIILEGGYRDSPSHLLGVFSSVENAKQRAREIVGLPRNTCYHDYFSIYRVIVDIGEPIHIETFDTEDIFKK